MEINDATSKLLINKYVRKLRKQGRGFIEIHTDLLAKTVHEDTVKGCIKTVSDEEILRLKRKSTKDTEFDKMIFGGAAFLIGLFIFVISYSNSNKGLGIYLVSYGPIISGFVYFRMAWYKYRKIDD